MEGEEGWKGDGGSGTEDEERGGGWRDRVRNKVGWREGVGDYDVRGEEGGGGGSRRGEEGWGIEGVGRGGGMEEGGR